MIATSATAEEVLEASHFSVPPATHVPVAQANVDSPSSNSTVAIALACVLLLALAIGAGAWYYQKLENERAIAVLRQQQETQLRIEAEARAQEAQRLAESTARLEAIRRERLEEEHRQQLDATRREQLQQQSEKPDSSRQEGAALVWLRNNNCIAQRLSADGTTVATVASNASIAFRVSPGSYQVRACQLYGDDCGAPVSVSWVAGENSHTINRNPSCR